MSSSFCPVPLELKHQQMKMRISHLLPLAILVSLGQGAQIWLLPCKSRFRDIVAQKGRVADSLPSVSSDHFRLQNPLNRSWCPLCSSWTSLEWKNRASFDSYFRASQNGIECTETDMHLSLDGQLPMVHGLGRKLMSEKWWTTNLLQIHFLEKYIIQSQGEELYWFHGWVEFKRWTR